MPKRFKILVLFALALTLIGASLIALTIGEIDIGFGDSIKFIFAPDNSYESRYLNSTLFTPKISS